MLVTMLDANGQSMVPFNGLLRDAQGNPIKNARVYVKDKRHFALSTKEGKFGLTDVKPTDTIHVLVRKHVYSIPVDGRQSMSIRLSDENNIAANEDQELIDIGYGYVKRREYTGGGSSRISGKELQDSGQAMILDALVGRVAGLVITGVGSERTVIMRGTKSINCDNTPLFIVDGNIVQSLDDINIYDVDYVEVMKEASIYGSSGANGAIIVRTRK